MRSQVRVRQAKHGRAEEAEAIIETELDVIFGNVEANSDEATETEAIIEAATIRLRPILMTTAAMVLGVVPLITASGAGAVSRYNMGLVIATGLSIGTLFTLFVVPVAYVLIARPTASRTTTPA